MADMTGARIAAKGVAALPSETSAITKFESPIFGVGLRPSRSHGSCEGPAS